MQPLNHPRPRPRPKRPSSDPPGALSADDTLSFRYLGGDPSLDLVNTVDWTSRGPERDRIGSYERLLEWALGAGVVDRVQAGQLERRAFTRQREAAMALDAARALRWTLRRLITALAGDARVGASVRLPLDELNLFIADAYGHVRLVMRSTIAPAASSSLTWTWERVPDRLDSVLWPVVRGAADLLASSDARRLRVCAGADCGWVYVDRSRNGLRRWCDMSTCGTAEKSRRRRERPDS